MGKKTGKVYVVGHKNPDTDSICSAIAYAELKKKLTGDEYVAKRAGQVNEETQYILSKFNVKAPDLLKNVKLQAKDLDIHKIEGVAPNVSIKDTWAKMKENNISSAVGISWRDKNCNLKEQVEEADFNMYKDKRHFYGSNNIVK